MSRPLLCWLEDCLPGIRIRPAQRPVAAIAYADDVTIFLTAPEDVEVLRQFLGSYERAKVNVNKSQALAVGRWDKARPVLEIPYCEEGFGVSYVCDNGTVDTYELGSSGGKRTHEVQRDIHARSSAITANTVCTYLYVSTHMAYSSDFPDTACMCSAPDGGNSMFLMAWCNLSGAARNVATREGRRRLGTTGCGGQVQCDLISPPMATRTGGGLSGQCMASVLAITALRCQPAPVSGDSEDNGI
jgi:hypothetical protein